MVLARLEGPPVADSAPFCPYVGLRPFREEDRPYFFGRENEIRTIADNLYGARLTILYGASGVGKSSVLMAGLVPQLRKEPRTAIVICSWRCHPHCSRSPNGCSQAARSASSTAA